MRVPTAIALLFGVLALLSAGCGGKSSSSTTTAVSASQWADGVCNSLDTWTTTVKSLASSLRSNPTKSAAQDSVTQAKDATKTLADNLKSLGQPNTASGQQAKADLNTLADELSADVDSIQAKINGASGITGLVTALADSASTFTSMGQQVTATFGEVQKLDVKGELKSAFSNSSSCKHLTGSG